jgi:hypothetical protein
VTTAAPRIGPTLLAGLERLDDETVPIAEVNRRLGRLAGHLGLPRPSYEQVRVLVHEHRERGLAPTAGQVLLEVFLRTRPPLDLVELLDWSS